MEATQVNECIICGSSSKPFSKPEHIIPQKLIKSNLILRGVVCDVCNQRFGRVLDTVFTGKLGKAAFNPSPKKLEYEQQSHDIRSELDVRATIIMENLEKLAQKKGEQNTTAIMTTGINEKTNKYSLMKFKLTTENDLYAKFRDRYLFALAKIAIEYLFYISIQRDVNIRKDDVFRMVCTALNEFTKEKNIGFETATMNANKRWAIAEVSVDENFNMAFKLNGIWHKVSLKEYIIMACRGNRYNLLYWLQIINIFDYVGVVVSLGNIPVVIMVVGSGYLAHRLCLFHRGCTLQECSSFSS